MRNAPERVPWWCGAAAPASRLLAAYAVAFVPGFLLFIFFETLVLAPCGCRRNCDVLCRLALAPHETSRGRRAAAMAGPCAVPAGTSLILRDARHADTGWTRFPPRLTGQPIFYPVLNEAYATKIARDWNTKDPASAYVGHVLRFEVEADYAQQFPAQRVGGAGIDELWIPAERLEEFNDHIVGKIGLVASYRADSAQK